MRSRKLVPFWCLAAVALAMAGCGGSHHASSPLFAGRESTAETIEPGGGMGGLQIGATLAAAQSALGASAPPGAAVRDSADGLVPVYWPAKGIAALFADAGRDGFASAEDHCVVVLAATAQVTGTGFAVVGKNLAGETGFAAFTGKTSGALGIGSTREAVRSALGEPDAGAPAGDWFGARGITVSYNADGKVVLAAVFAAQAGGAEALKIEPGVGAGVLKVGDTYGNALAAFGQAAGTRSEVSDESAVVHVSWPERGLMAAYNDSNRDTVPGANETCLMVSVTSPYVGRTAEGAGIGSTKEQVRTALGAPGEQAEDVDFYLTKGAVFCYDSDGVVEAVRLMRPYQVAAAGNTRIAPGAGIGGIRLNGTMAEATGIYGPPDSVRTRASLGPAVLLASWPSVGLYAIVSDQDENGKAEPTEKVITVLAAAPYGGISTEGVGISTRREQVAKAFGSAERQGTTDWYATKGVIFAYDGEGYVQSVAVFRPQGGGAVDEIQEGRAVGALWIGATYSAALSRYGEPAAKKAYADPEGWGAVLAKWPDRGLLAWYDDVDLDGQVSPTERCILAYAAMPYAGHTQVGLGIAATREQVRTAYGTPEEEETNADWYWTKGLVVNYGSTGLVRSIGIYAPVLPDEAGEQIGVYIQPGISVGPLLLGMTYADALARFSEPGSLKALTAGDRKAVLAIWPLIPCSATFRDADGDGQVAASDVCDMAWARSPFGGRTEEGIGTDNTRVQVHNAYGNPEQTQEGGIDWYWSRGLVFNYDAEDEVWSIGVFAPGAGPDRSLTDLAAGTVSRLRSRSAAAGAKPSPAAVKRRLNAR